MRNFIKRFVALLPAREEGQGIVEYAIVLGVIVVGVAAAWQLLPIQTTMQALINNITTLIP